MNVVRTPEQRYRLDIYVGVPAAYQLRLVESVELTCSRDRAECIAFALTDALHTVRVSEVGE